jgi:hypothetical protein
MQPFDVSPLMDVLTEIYPPANNLLPAIRAGNRDVRLAVSRLWLSEGIPFAFRNKPSIYEALRGWLSRELQVEAKGITIVGSGRNGFCLSPGKTVGLPFGPHSDLDLTVVSSILFESLHAAFLRWKQDYTHGQVAPKSERQKVFWDNNIEKCPRNLERGFIDIHKIPTLGRYPEVQKVANALWRAGEKLALTPNAPNVKRMSLRVYVDWNSFMKQMALNLGNV